MTQRTPREVIDAYVDAMDRGDWVALRALLADDDVEEYPQSGERIRGPAVGPAYIVGGEGRWALAPNFTALRVAADGDTVTALSRMLHPDGPWHIVDIGTVEQGRIRRATPIFAAPFEPAPWRAAWVEQIPEGER